MLRFFVGCDPMVLLQRFGLTHRPVFHLRVGRRLRDDELQSQHLRLVHDLKTLVFVAAPTEVGVRTVFFLISSRI